MNSIGIDLGTCLCSVAVLDEHKKPIALRIDTGISSLIGDSYSIPSSIFVEEDERILLGQAADNIRMKSPSKYRKEFKRDLGTDEPYHIGSMELFPEDIYKEFLKYFKIKAEEAIGWKVSKAVVSHPANFAGHKKELIRKAALIAGFQEVELIDEPTAAAIYYASKQKVEVGEKLLIYDLGGGTFDVSLIVKEEEGFRALTAPLGIERCGGVDFQRKIYDDILDNFHDELYPIISRRDEASKRLSSLIEGESIKLKHQLSSAESAQCVITLPTFDCLNYNITREKFEAKINEYITNSCTRIEDIVKNAGLTMKDIDRVLLVGGSSRIPYVEQMVKKVTGRPVYKDADTELVVCFGACVWGNRTTKSSTVETSKKEQITDNKNTELGKTSLFNPFDEANKEQEKINYGSFHMIIEDKMQIPSRGRALFGKIIKGNINVGDNIYIHRDFGIATTYVTNLFGYKEVLSRASAGSEIMMIVSNSINYDTIKAGQSITKEKLESTIKVTQVTQQSFTKDQKLNIKKDIEAFDEASREDTTEAYEKYILGSTIKAFKYSANNRLEKLKSKSLNKNSQSQSNQTSSYNTKLDEEAWQRAVREDTLEAYEKYLSGNYSKTHEKIARAAIEDIRSLTQKNSIENNISSSKSFMDSYSKGINFYKQKKYEEALECFERCITIKKDKDVYNYEGIVYYELGDYSKAIKFYDMAIKLDKNYEHGHYNKGIALDKMKEYRDAVKYYNKTLEINPKHRGAAFNKGTDLYNLGSYEEAIQSYDIAIKLNPKYMEAHYNKGLCLYNLKKYEEALPCFNRALEIRPSDADAKKYKELCAKALGSKGGCFLTTAVCEILGKSDDCYELETLRHFRDNTLLKSKQGSEIVKQYYDIAPPIAEKLKRHRDKEVIASEVLNIYIYKIIEDINCRKNEKAIKKYEAMVSYIKNIVNS